MNNIKVSHLSSRLACSAVGLAFAIGLASGAYAQAEADGGNAASEPGEIIVTARKRGESLTKVPEAITAFNAEKIEQAGLQSLRDFTDLTPNVTISSGSGTAYPNIMIRGLAQAQGGEAPIAVVIDGVQLSHPAFISQDYGDVAQVEVLRGPQGSLYGRNAIGGAMNITTKMPSEELEGSVKMSYGNGNTFTGSADISSALVPDKVLFRVGASYRDTDGFIRNITTGKRADYGRNLFLRGRLIFNVTDRLTVDLRGNYGNDRVGVVPAEIVPNQFWDDFRPGFLAANPSSLLDQRELYDFSAKVDYRTDYLTITSITDYSHVKDRLRGDADFSAVHAVLQDVRLRVKAFTQELRISSPSEERFRWLIGGFYQDRDTKNFLDVPLDDGTGQPVTPAIYAVQSHDMGTSKSWAVFGSASYDIVPQLELTLGARYDEDKRTSVDEIISGSAVSDKFTSFQPKVQLSYKPGGDLNFYATYSEGFSSGGFNATTAGPNARRYGAETAENYEAGMKAGFLNGKINFNIAAFRVYYKDQQFFFITANPPSQNITNIDKTRVDGLEAELYIRAIPNLDLSAGLGITDSKILRFAAEPTSEGNHSPQNTAYTLNLSGQYTIPLSDGLDLRAYASYRRQGALYWDAANTLRTEPKDFVNLRLTVEGGNWSLGGYVNNLTNSQYPMQAAANAVASGLSLRVPSPRRTYGIEGRYKF